MRRTWPSVVKFPAFSSRLPTIDASAQAGIHGSELREM